MKSNYKKDNDSPVLAAYTFIGIILSQ